MSAYKTQPPWEFLLPASRNSLQSFELSRLSHASNLRKEITQLLDSWLEENSEAMLARWLMEHASGLARAVRTRVGRGGQRRTHAGRRHASQCRALCVR